MAVRHVDAIGNHWYWRPGWHFGSRLYAWHLTFADQPEVAELAESYRELLAGQPVLDVIPTEWLHLTMQGVGFVEQVERDQVDAIVAAARTRCADLAPFPLSIGAPHVNPESVQISVEPADAVREVRTTLRAAIADVWGAEGVPEPAEPYRPHLSLAYANADSPAAPLVEALAHGPEATATAHIRSCQLIVINRDERMYVWEPYATVTLGG